MSDTSKPNGGAAQNPKEAMSDTRAALTERIQDYLADVKDQPRYGRDYLAEDLFADALAALTPPAEAPRCGGTGFIAILPSSPGPPEGEFCRGCPDCEPSPAVQRRIRALEAELTGLKAEVLTSTEQQSIDRYRQWYYDATAKAEQLEDEIDQLKATSTEREEAIFLCNKLEAYPFESEGGSLRLCVDWQRLRAIVEGRDNV